MNSNEKMRKLQKTGRIAYIVLTVFQVLTVLLALGVILGGYLRGGEFIEKANLIFSPVAQNVFTSGTLLLVILCVLVKLALYFVILALSRQIFRGISQDGTPFRQIHVRRMKWIALLVFVASFIHFFSIQLIGCLAALLIWCISMVLDYGCQLQQESDETL